MTVSIIIPNYNGAHLLRENLPSVLRAAQYFEKKTKNSFEIIVVDDYSSDTSIEEVKKLIPNAKIYANERNVGFSSSVNKGVKKSLGDVVVLLNTDVKPQEDFLLPLIVHFENENVFAVGCMDKSIEGKTVVLRGRGVGQWRKGFLVHARGDVNKKDTLWVNGGSGAFKKLIWERLGGFSDLYKPFYWEDIDISYRALKSGYKLIFEPNSIVIHEHERGIIKKKYSSFKIKTIAYKNQFIFVWKNATDIDLLLSHVLWLPYHFLKAALRCDSLFFIGFLQAFILLPNIIQSNLESHKLFIKSDRKVVEEFLE